MSVQFNEAHAPRTEPAQVDYEDWDLDVSIVESGPSADMLIRMTDDGCNSTCASACTSCP